MLLNLFKLFVGLFIKQAHCQSLTELQQVYRDAEAVENFTVFNIKGNKYRLILDIDYEEQVAYFKYFLAHADYDKEKWKNDPYGSVKCSVSGINTYSGNLPSNSIANRFNAPFQFLIGIVHFLEILFSAKKITFITDSSVGKERWFFSTFLKVIFIDSIALVV